MIPAIGTMIGVYIITRMLDLLAADRHSVVKGFAVASMLITIFCLIALLSAGSAVDGLR